MSIERLTCCGLFELSGVQSVSAEEAVREVCENWFDEDEQGAYIIFTTVEGLRGTQLAKFIKKFRLGDVQKQRPAINANTSNRLSMWVWRVNKTELQAYWKRTNRQKVLENSGAVSLGIGWQDY